MNLFFGFLGIAAWQDLKTRSIRLEVLLIGILAGILICLSNNRTPQEVLISMIPGGILLLISIATGGLLGEGDGYFFLVSGLFLTWRELLFLFVCGEFFCSIFGLAMLVGTGMGNRKILSSGKMRLPFLPFLVPAALWMAVIRYL